MRRSVGGPIVLVIGTGLLILSGCATTGVIAKHPDFKARHARIHAMTILPPTVEVYKLTFKGDREQMYDLLAPIAAEATEELQTTLTQRGYAMHPLNLNDDAGGSPELKRSLHTIRDVFHKRIGEYQKRWFPAFRQFTYSVGSEVNLIADQTNSDAIVIVQCTGLKKTGGEITKDIAQSALIFAATLGSVLVINHASATVIQMAVIDGDTGDILWYADNSEDAAFDIADASRFRGVIRNMISQFPKAIAQRPATPIVPPSRSILERPAMPSPTAP